MNVFVAYGFRKRDSWIRDHVIPLLNAVGATAVTGERLAGQQISNAVRDRIRSCDGIVGFLTARDEAGTADETHTWVLQELALGVDAGLKVLEVREAGLTNQGGLLGDRQHIPYDPADEAGCLVSIAETVGEWTRGLTMRVLLLPEDIVTKIAPLMRSADFRCTYRILEHGREEREQPAKLIRRPGGLQLTASGLPPTALLSIRVAGGRESYVSPYVDADALVVTLEQEA